MLFCTPKVYILLFWFNDDWGKYGRAYERVAEALAQLPEVNHVTCIFPPNSKSSDSPLDIRDISRKLTLLAETNFTHLRQSGHLFNLRNSLNDYLKTRVLKKYLKSIGYRKKNTILWLFPPDAYIEKIVYTVPHRVVVTHVIDNFTKFDSNHHLYAAAHEQYPKLGKWSDMIITTSPANQQEFSKLGRPCFLFPPAVDQIFISNPEALPHLISRKSPRLGYVGFIMDRTDLELIRYIAEHRPDWHLILAGPQYPEGYLNNSGLLDLPNIEYIGPVNQNDVPDLLRTFDVCLMPHRDTEYSRSMGPLKLYQYLASGRPIVSSNVSGLDMVRDHILVANSHSEFVGQIETALLSDTIEKSAKRIEIAKLNTWSVRVREMFETIQKMKVGA